MRFIHPLIVPMFIDCISNLNKLSQTLLDEMKEQLVEIGYEGLRNNELTISPELYECNAHGGNVEVYRNKIGILIDSIKSDDREQLSTIPTMVYLENIYEATAKYIALVTGADVDDDLTDYRIYMHFHKDMITITYSNYQPHMEYLALQGYIEISGTPLEAYLQPEWTKTKSDFYLSLWHTYSVHNKGSDTEDTVVESLVGLFE